MIEELDVSFELRSMMIKGSNMRLGIVIPRLEYCHKIWFDECMFAYGTKTCFEL